MTHPINVKSCALAVFLTLLIFSCKTSNTSIGRVESRTSKELSKSDFTITFGSCNKTEIDNLLWDDILNVDPDIWIWGGDNVYADTDDMVRLQAIYNEQQKIEGYAKLLKSVPVIGTWDDHDYGLNDGGVEFKAKKESQAEFLNFMGVPNNDPRRSQEGIYTSHTYDLPQGKIKILILDTRYFRTALTPDNETKKRTKPNVYGEGTVLGEPQWKWLDAELKNSDAEFNILVSSIQFLSNKHGFECWGNFPHEVDKLKDMIVTSKAKGVIMLSGDRHISEFSKAEVAGLAFPLIDFTSSGLTHAYRKFSGEPNPYRVGQVVAKESFGVLHFDFNAKNVQFKMLGDRGKVFGELEQKY